MSVFRETYGQMVRGTSLPDKYQKMICDAAKNDLDLLCSLARRRDLSDETKLFLKGQKSAKVQAALFGSLDESEIFEAVSKEKRVTVLRSAAQAREVSVELLEVLSYNDNSKVAYAVFRNSKSSFDAKKRAALTVLSSSSSTQAAYSSVASYLDRDSAMACQLAGIADTRSGTIVLSAARAQFGESKEKLLEKSIAQLIGHGRTVRILSSLISSPGIDPDLFEKFSIELSGNQQYGIHSDKKQQILSAVDEYRRSFGLSAEELAVQFPTPPASSLVNFHLWVSGTAFAARDFGFDFETSFSTLEPSQRKYVVQNSNDIALIESVYSLLGDEVYQVFSFGFHYDNFPDQVAVAKSILRIVSEQQQYRALSIRTAAVQLITDKGSDEDILECLHSLPWSFIDTPRCSNEVRLTIFDKVLESCPYGSKRFETFSAFLSSFEGTVGELLEIVETLSDE